MDYKYQLGLPNQEEKMGAGNLFLNQNPVPSLNQNLNLHLSQESVDRFIFSLNKSVSIADVATVVAAIAAAFSSIFALIMIIQNRKGQKELLVQSLHNHFFEINKHLALKSKPTLKDNELLANFLERVADLVESNQVPIGSVSGYKSMMTEPSLMRFVQGYRKKFGKSYFTSITWLIDQYKKDKKKSFTKKTA
ncbi:hypothetical protein ACFL18_02825 [Patescibacteria group bacterium]